MNKVQMMAELRKAVQIFLSRLDPEENEELIISVPTVFPAYEVDKLYKVKEVFRYGENAVGDPQLYQVLQEHTSAIQWKPDEAVSLYKKIGIAEDGIPEWVQPLGAMDAYNTGDRVHHNEAVWESTVDNNVWQPGVYGWQEVVES